MPTPQVLLDNLMTGSVLTSRNLTLIPLVHKEPARPAIPYLLAATALDRDLLTVTEADDSGSVPELRAVNDADIAVLLLDGEELIGAKQNRILNTDVLLSPHTGKMIPVSCVEQGRWHHTRPDFAPGGHAPPPIRARKSRTVGRNLKESNEAVANQCEVWDGVDMVLDGMATSSHTAAMCDAYDQHRDDLASRRADLRCPPDAVGVIALINGAFAALDLFDSPSTVQQFWPRLVTGYAVDATMRVDQQPTSTPPTADAADILRRLGRVDCTVCDGVDLGEDWRFESADLVGSALVIKNSPVHLSAFPNDTGYERAMNHQGRIAPPSQRHHGHGPVC